jgi:hypothetical protein
MFIVFFERKQNLARPFSRALIFCSLICIGRAQSRRSGNTTRHSYCWLQSQYSSSEYSSRCGTCRRRRASPLRCIPRIDPLHPGRHHWRRRMKKRFQMRTMGIAEKIRMILRVRVKEDKRNISHLLSRSLTSPISSLAGLPRLSSETLLD